MSKFNKYILSTKFRPKRSAANFNSFENQFGKYVEPRKKPVSRLSDAEGLERAYKDGDTHVHGKTMYVAGSHTLQDWWDDVTKIPVWGDLRESARYKAAEKVLRENPQVEDIVGHSLGGSVVLELQKQYGDRGLKSRTYGAPVLDFTSPLDNTKVERYRNYLDPVSIFDRGANKSVKWNPFDNGSLTHTFENIGEHKYVEEDYGK